MIPKEDGEKLALKFNIKFSEASAKNKLNVHEIFVGLAKDILETKKPSDKLSDAGISLTANESKKPQNKNEKKCCS